MQLCSAPAGSAQASDGDQVTTDGIIPTRHTLGGIIPTAERHALLRESIAAAVAAAVERNAEGMVDPSASDPSRPALTESNGHAEQGFVASTGQEGTASQAGGVTGFAPAAPDVSPAPVILSTPTAVAASREVGGDRDAGDAASVQVSAPQVESVGEASEGVHGLPPGAQQQERQPGQLQVSDGTVEVLRKHANALICLYPRVSGQPAPSMLPCPPAPHVSMSSHPTSPHASLADVCGQIQASAHLRLCPHRASNPCGPVC